MYYLYECTSLLINLTSLGVLVYFALIILELKRYINNIIYKMDKIRNNQSDELDGLDEIEVEIPGNNEDMNKKRERLSALAIGGQAKKFLGKDISVEQIERIDDAGINKMYNKYESRLGAAMTKTLSKSILTLYSYTIGTILPISETNQVKLVEDLESDPFVGHAISSFTCSLYHSYGMYLAPLTAALTTARYCDFNNSNNINNINNSNNSNNGERSGEEGRDNSGFDYNDGEDNY